jgi:hypothetical protein
MDNEPIHFDLHPERVYPIKDEAILFRKRNEKRQIYGGDVKVFSLCRHVPQMGKPVKSPEQEKAQSALNVQGVRRRDKEYTVLLQDTVKLSKGMMVVFDMFQTFQACHVIETVIVIGKSLIQIHSLEVSNRGTREEVCGKIFPCTGRQFMEKPAIPRRDV